MELREDPRVRAGAVSDDEEEEEFQDSREDQFDQILVSNLNSPPALDLGQPGPILMGLPGTSVQGGNQAIGWEGKDMVENLVQDTKFYQDTALELQGAYEDLYQWQIKLQGKMNSQSSSRKHQHLLKLQMLKLSEDIKPCLMPNVINNRSSIKLYRVQFSSTRCS